MISILSIVFTLETNTVYFVSTTENFPELHRNLLCGDLDENKFPNRGAQWNAVILETRVPTILLLHPTSFLRIDSDEELRYNAGSMRMFLISSMAIRVRAEWRRHTGPESMSTITPK